MLLFSNPIILFHYKNLPNHIRFAPQRHEARRAQEEERRNLSDAESTMTSGASRQAFMRAMGSGRYTLHGEHRLPLFDDIRRPLSSEASTHTSTTSSRIPGREDPLEKLRRTRTAMAAEEKNRSAAREAEIRARLQPMRAANVRAREEERQEEQAREAEDTHRKEELASEMGALVRDTKILRNDSVLIFLTI